MPADMRIRCVTVSNAWRSFLSEAGIWRICNLSLRSGVVSPSTPSLLRCLVIKAQRTLEVLDVHGLVFDDHIHILGERCAEHFRCLRILRVDEVLDYSGRVMFFTAREVQSILDNSPALTEFRFCGHCEFGEDWTQWQQLLRLAILLPVTFSILGNNDDNCAVVVLCGLRELCETGIHPRSLTRIVFQAVPFREVAQLEVLVYYAALSGLLAVALHECSLIAESYVPAATLLLGNKTLRELAISAQDEGPQYQLIRGEGREAFCAALSQSGLVSLKLHNVGLWLNTEYAKAVIAACTTLRELNVRGNGVVPAVIGEALEELRAKIPQLRLQS